MKEPEELKNQEATAPEEELKEAPAPEEPKEEKKTKAKSRKDSAAAKLEKALQEKQEYFDALLRERADFDNYKKRNAVAVSKAYADGKGDAAASLLPVLDNLDRALSVAEDGPLKEGVLLVQRQMIDVFKSMGIEEIEAEGKEFDPNFHNAVMQAPADEGEESGMVKDVLQKGYRMGDRVLRHSMVRVVE